MSETPTVGRLKRPAIAVAFVVFFAIIVISLVLALSTPVSLPSTTGASTTQTAPAPYVLVEVYDLSSTNYTTTITTTPQLSVRVIVLPEVLVVVNGTMTYSTTKNFTSTLTV